MNTAIEISTDEEIENYSKIFNHAMTSMAEGSWVPVGVIYGAKWMRDKLSPYLKRKVKKDPRVDGLPEANQLGRYAEIVLSNDLIIWKKDNPFPFIGYYSLTDNLWHPITGTRKTPPIPTDEILFYADPNEII